MLNGILYIYVMFISGFVICGFLFGFLAFVGPYKKMKLISIDSKNTTIEEFKIFNVDYEVVFELENFLVIRVPLTELLNNDESWYSIVNSLRLRGVHAIIVQEDVEFLKVKKC